MRASGQQVVQENPDIDTRRSLPRGRLRALLVAILALVTALTIGITVLHGVQIVRLVEEHTLTQARSYADLVIAARSWNAHHGGVYVRKSSSVETNPYLLTLGVQADVQLKDGSLLTLRNPSLMTSEIGREMNENGMPSSLKLTSLQLVNPKNEPDEWEAEQLRRFSNSDTGIAEAWSTTASGNDAVQRFRYMRALIVDESCLECHGNAGYRVGDVRGALSVSLPYAETAAALADARAQLIIIAVLILVVVWTAVVAGLRIQERQIAASEQALKTAAATDPLTGLLNRGYIYSRLESEVSRMRRTGSGIGLILADIDDFKHVNDTHGHAAGDDVLRTLADVITSAVRDYDVVGRIGGEELLVLAPDSTPDALDLLAERIRAAVEQSYAEESPYGRISISAGTAFMPPDSAETVDELVARADAAMYEAKRAGKNCVMRG